MSDLTLLAQPPAAPTLSEVAERWQASRVDASENKKLMHRSSVRALLPLLGMRPVDTSTPSDVQELIGALAAKGRKRETINPKERLGWCSTTPAYSRTLHATACTSACLGPSTSRSLRRAGRGRRARPSERLAAAGARARGTGMRVGELERLAWGDVDEARGRWRVWAGSSKTGRARW
jgi:integrase